MADTDKEREVAQAALTAKANEVRQLKEGGASKADLAPHLEELKALKKAVDALVRYRIACLLLLGFGLTSL